MSRQTFIEKMLDAYHESAYPVNGLIVADSFDMDAGLVAARAKVMFDFGRKPPSFKLRALMENWDRETLIREMY